MTMRFEVSDKECVFNYIITIHNKQDLLPKVLEGIATCCSKQSRIIPVLDGCTDRSEVIVDEFIATSGLDVEKVITPDVYEIRALNAGIARVQRGYIVCIQDDVVLMEPDLQGKLEELYEREGASLGVVSPRHGMNIRRTSVLRQLKHSGVVPVVSEFDRIVRPEEAEDGLEVVEYGHLVFRMIAGGSPMVIPESVWRRIGAFDEYMAPHMWADHEYSLRALKKGFRNAVFPLRFESKSEWGSFRQNLIKKKVEWDRINDGVVLRNRRYIWKKHGKFIDGYLKRIGKPRWTLI